MRFPLVESSWREFRTLIGQYPLVAAWLMQLSSSFVHILLYITLKKLYVLSLGCKCDSANRDHEQNRVDRIIINLLI